MNTPIETLQMANPATNQQIIDEVFTALEELHNHYSEDSLAGQDVLTDTATLDVAVSAIEQKIHAINFQSLTADEIEKVTDIQSALQGLSQNLVQQKDKTKKAIQTEQNKSKLQKAYR